MRILVIEDEYTLADVIRAKLEKEKYIVDISQDGGEGLYKALTDIYDLIILDVMLPNLNGFEILKKLREEKVKSKIIMLTARSTLSDKLEGLNGGANDYITKPFHIEELTARVNIQLRNVKLDTIQIIKFNDLELNVKESKITCIKNNQSVELVCKEYQLFEYFMSNPNQILSKEQIYDKIWGIERDTESNNLEVYLSFMRKKLRAIDSSVCIKSSRGLGYKLGVKDE